MRQWMCKLMCWGLCVDVLSLCDDVLIAIVLMC
jgi:hypothetical protein